MAWDEKDFSALDAVKTAVGTLMIDFKNWTMADTKAFKHWKALKPHEAIKVAPSRMIDDVDSMLSKYRQQDSDKGYVAPLPVMIIAMATMVSPPDVSMLRGVPYWVDTMLPNDPEKRRIKARAISRQYRVQVAFIAPEGDTCQGVINQFCNYMQDDFKRRITADYNLGDGITGKWQLTVLENSLFPDSVPTGQNNVSVATVDFQIIGLLPQIVGITGQDADVDPNNRPPKPTDPNEPQGEWDVVVQADLLSIANEPTVQRALADKDTGEKWIERVERDE